MKNKQTAGSFGVIGLGRFGTALAITLSEAGKDVIAIDRDEDKVKAIRQYTDYAFVAETINMESLKETGIQNCDVVAVCIGEQIDRRKHSDHHERARAWSAQGHLQGHEPGTGSSPPQNRSGSRLSGKGYGDPPWKTSDQ